MLPWKTFAHANVLVGLLNGVKNSERDSLVADDANRLMQKIMSIGDDVWKSCAGNPYAVYKVAFMPTAEYDDDDGSVTFPADCIDYGTADRKEKNRIQAVQAVKDWRDMLSSVGLTEEDLKY